MPGNHMHPGNRSSRGQHCNPQLHIPWHMPAMPRPPGHHMQQVQDRGDLAWQYLLSEQAMLPHPVSTEGQSRLPEEQAPPQDCQPPAQQQRQVACHISAPHHRGLERDMPRGSRP